MIFNLYMIHVTFPSRVWASQGKVWKINNGKLELTHIICFTCQLFRLWTLSCKRSRHKQPLTPFYEEQGRFCRKTLWSKIIMDFSYNLYKLLIFFAHRLNCRNRMWYALEDDTAWVADPWTGTMGRWSIGNGHLHQYLAGVSQRSGLCTFCGHVHRPPPTATMAIDMTTTLHPTR